MRSLFALALALVACSGNDRKDVPDSSMVSAIPARGPDALMLRVPKDGGVARVTAYPKLDSTVWTSSDATPALDRVLAFDADAGIVAAVSARGLPIWIDIRNGSVTSTGRGTPHALTTVDGATIYGLGVDGNVARFTTTGNWLFHPPQPARGVFPEASGSILVLGGRDTSARLWRVHPPDTTITDTLPAQHVADGVDAPLGDRVFLTRTQPKRPAEILGLRTRTLELGRPIRLDHRPVAMASTPSGDRAYVVVDSAPLMVGIDPYQNSIVSRTELPGQGRDLRVDPFGRYVLVRAASGDSVWVVSVGTDRVVETVRSTWRGDLPFVALDGSIATLVGKDVIFKGDHDVRVPGGASDFWYPFSWNGLRARSAALDEQPAIPTDADTAMNTAPDSAADTTASTGLVAPPPPRPDTVRAGFTVSFAVLLDEEAARAQASKIVINGQPARVVTSITSGTTVFRVVAGPFATREEADRAGRASGHTYVVYAGAP